MDISSVLFSFSESALKRLTTASKAEIRQVMLVQHKTHLEVHGSGRTMIQK